MGRLSDEEILALLCRAAGDGTDAEEAWRVLDKELLPRIRSFLTKRLGRTRAEEVTQEVFVNLVDVLRRGRPLQPVAYVWAMVRNAANKVPSKNECGYDELFDRAERRQAHDDQFNDRQRLEWALSKLPPRQRDAIELHHIQGLSYEQIAKSWGVTPGTVRTNVHFGRKRLQRLLEG